MIFLIDSFWLMVFGIIVSFIVVTFLLKKFFNANTWLIISILKTTKFLPILDKFSHLGKWLDRFAEIGLILGFGTIAVDYLYGRKQTTLKRIFYFITSFILLSVFYYFTFNNLITANPLTKNYALYFLIIFSFAGFSGFTLLSLITNAIDIVFKTLFGIKACPGVAPLLPGVKIPGLPFVPLHGWLSLFIILIIHEGMHGILARRHGFQIKSTGLLLLGFLPIGAFVEPDEDELNKAEPRKALHVFAAGPTANLVTVVIGTIILLTFTLFIVGPIEPEILKIRADSIDFVEIHAVQKNFEVCGDVYPSDAFEKLEAGNKLIALNDKKINTTFDALTELKKNLGKPLFVKFENNSGQQKEVTLQPNEFNVYGFSLKEKQKENYSFPTGYQEKVGLLSFISDFLGWFILLNLLIALVNFLPMNPFDGGRIAVLMFLPYFAFLKMPDEKTKKLIGRVFLVIILFLLLLNMIPLFI